MMIICTIHYTIDICIRIVICKKDNQIKDEFILRKEKHARDNIVSDIIE